MNRDSSEDEKDTTSNAGADEKLQINDRRRISVPAHEIDALRSKRMPAPESDASRAKWSTLKKYRLLILFILGPVVIMIAVNNPMPLVLIWTVVIAGVLLLLFIAGAIVYVVIDRIRYSDNKRRTIVKVSLTLVAGGVIASALILYHVPYPSKSAAVWARPFERTCGPNYEYAYYIDTRSDGGYFVAGKLIIPPYVPLSAPAGELGKTIVNSWFAKVSSNGKLEWKDEQKTGETRINALLRGDNGVFADSGGIKKLNHEGTEVCCSKGLNWLNGKYPPLIEAIRETADGGYILAGAAGQGRGHDRFPLTYGGFLMKTSKDASLEWSTMFGPPGYKALEVRQSSDGGFFAAGRADKSLLVLGTDRNGVVKWQKIFEGIHIPSDGMYGPGGEPVFLYGMSEPPPLHLSPARDGNYLIMVRLDDTGAYDPVLLIMKMTPRGAVLWQKTFGGPFADKIYSVDNTRDGGWILAGSTKTYGAGEYDVWLVKISADGEIEWQRTYGRSGDDVARSVRQTADGGYIVAADISFELIPWFVRDNWWVIKLDAAGNTACETWIGCFEVRDSATVMRTASFPGKNIRLSTFRDPFDRPDPPFRK